MTRGQKLPIPGWSHEEAPPRFFSVLAVLSKHIATLQRPVFTAVWFEDAVQTTLGHDLVSQVGMNADRMAVSPAKRAQRLHRDEALF